LNPLAGLSQTNVLRELRIELVHTDAPLKIRKVVGIGEFQIWL
jgi:hypothetical protein